MNIDRVFAILLSCCLHSCSTSQADIIWDALFVMRSPISEATRGVLTTLSALGLGAHVKSRDLAAIRSFYDTYRKDGLIGAEQFSELVYKISGVRYAIMTNIPFDSVRGSYCYFIYADKFRFCF